MVSRPFCFVDLETTGIDNYANRIIEIGIVKVENDKITREYSQLINPQRFLDPFIENLTGISPVELEKAPTFSEVAAEILEILDGSIFVAHNVRFDYGFIRREFQQLGYIYRSKHFDTIKLARSLFPQLKRYNLDSIIENFNIKCESRHRAFNDARALWDFFQIARKKVPAKKFEKSLDIALRKPTIPINLSEEYLDDLPYSPGVYIFYGDSETPLYIGKSVNIRDRVLSHFTNDYITPTDMKISQQVKHIEVIKTSGELGALLTESNLIKKMQPIYNRRLRSSRKISAILKMTLENKYHSYEVKFLEDVTVDEIDRVIGIFKSPKQMKNILFEKAKEYNLCPKLLNLEKTKKACFYNQLAICKGACTNKENYLKYNLRFDEAFYSSKLKPWNFEKPVLIKEEGESTEYFVIDKWCFLGSLKTEADSFEELNKDYSFDFDTYKILSKFIYNPKNSNKILYR